MSVREMCTQVSGRIGKETDWQEALLRVLTTAGGRRVTAPARAVGGPDLGRKPHSEGPEPLPGQSVLIGRERRSSLRAAPKAESSHADEGQTQFWEHHLLVPEALGPAEGCAGTKPVCGFSQPRAHPSAAGSAGLWAASLGTSFLVCGRASESGFGADEFVTGSATHPEPGHPWQHLLTLRAPGGWAGIDAKG